MAAIAHKPVTPKIHSKPAARVKAARARPRSQVAAQAKAKPANGADSTARRLPRYSAKTVSRQRARNKFWLGQCVGMMLTFCFLAFLVYLGSSLTGQVLLEQARRDSITASQKAKQAKLEQTALRDRLDSMTGVASIDRWASVQGMNSPIQTAISIEQETPIFASATIPIKSR